MVPHSTQKLYDNCIATYVADKSDKANNDS